MKRFSKQIPHLYVHNDTFIYRRVIPNDLRKLAGKSEFKATLSTKDKNEALKRYSEAHDHYNTLLVRLLSGEPLVGNGSFEDYARKAESQGRQLIDLKKLLEKPALLIKTGDDWKKATDKSVENFRSYINASQGDIRLSSLVSFYEDYENYDLVKLNKRERDKKLNPLKNAIVKLMEHLNSDKLVSELTRDDAKSFHKMLKDKISENHIQANTANKYITHLRVLLNKYNESRDFECKTVFDELNFKSDDRKRPSFTLDFLKENWFSADYLSGLNLDARNLLLAVVDTGCSFKELCGLRPSIDIRLNDEIPHIVISENSNRMLKTKHRARKIPLVGKSLSAFQARPNGFERYATDIGPTNASATVNKYLRDHNLLETNDHSVYSLRHTFKDRLRSHNIYGEMQDVLMGHKAPGMGAHYGTGYKLSTLHDALKSIATDWNS